MKVWMCKRTDDFGGFCGGLAVVAANDIEEAFKTFLLHEEYSWKADYYPFERWFECKELTANVDKPCVIMEDGYTE